LLSDWWTRQQAPFRIPMSFHDTIKAIIGSETYVRLESEAEKEVRLAMAMPLLDQYHQENYYKQRFLLGELRTEAEAFENAGLKILPADLVNVFFKCKLLFACKSEHEYLQRGGGPYFFDDRFSGVRWTERSEKVDILVARRISQLETAICERTLVTTVNSFTSLRGDANVQKGFDELFAKLGLPYDGFFDEDYLVEKHEEWEPGLRNYDKREAQLFYCAPSIGFTTSGSREYCFWRSVMWLRTFLNLLRVASYIHPGQIDFGRDVKMTPPRVPVFLGEHAQGMFKWDEYKNESWAKIPDGSLFLSFGYRGLSEMWLDRRTWPKIQSFLIKQIGIFNSLKNPWGARSMGDVSPTLDILSSATQMPDFGAKILLIYCCLEHLFVPKNTKSDNNKYIVGGINALAPHLLPWFYKVYDLRCSYAHKGFVPWDGETMSLIAESMKNTIAILGAKLSLP
jgi:hypothetical protein